MIARPPEAATTSAAPARAHATDPEAWLPLPLIQLIANVSPSPARAEPHDPAAWLPLPIDFADLPPVSELLDPDPDLQITAITEAEAVVHSAFVAAQAAVELSPARAEPHDASSWLPLPDVHSLPEVAREAPPRPPLRHRLVSARPPIRLLMIALVATAIVLSAAWAGSRLTAPAGAQVTVVVDGQQASVHTEATTVRELLARRNVRLAAADRVTPAPTVRLHDGLRIDVVRAFTVSVDLDGQVSSVSTTYGSADKLADQMGAGKLVAVRGTPGELRAGTNVVLRTRHTGTLMLDGRTIMYDSPSLTVKELLETYSVVLVGDDRVEPGPTTKLTDGMNPKVVRVGGEIEQEPEPIPFTDEIRPDPTLPIGQTRVAQEGVAGIMTNTYKVTTENGTAAGRTLLSKVPAVEPKPRIVEYGTLADWHWDALATCESGGRWSTVDATAEGYDGGLGIYRGTWKAFGGLEFAPNAGLATREEQIIVGQRIYNRHGWSAWGCARQMHWS